MARFSNNDVLSCRSSRCSRQSRRYRCARSCWLHGSCRSSWWSRSHRQHRSDWPSRRTRTQGFRRPRGWSWIAWSDGFHWVARTKWTSGQSWSTRADWIARELWTSGIHWPYRSSRTFRRTRYVQRYRPSQLLCCITVLHLITFSPLILHFSSYHC